MAKFFRNKNNIGYLKITNIELIVYSENLTPVCDECSKSIVGHSNIVLIPILNEAYCPKCGEEVLNRIKNYPEDRPIRERREQFYLDCFGIKEW